MVNKDEAYFSSNIIPSVHKGYTNQLDLIDIVIEFVRESHCRESILGIFYNQIIISYIFYKLLHKPQCRSLKVYTYWVSGFKGVQTGQTHTTLGTTACDCYITKLWNYRIFMPLEDCF